MKRIFAVLLLIMLTLTACSTEQAVVEEAEVAPTVQYATTIQHNNRTVRVKNFNRVLADKKGAEKTAPLITLLITF